MSEAIECPECINGIEYVDTSTNCDKPVGDCCGGCGYDQQCVKCGGTGLIKNDEDE